jgi:hypothetical protein
MNVVDFKPSPKVKRLARQLLAEANKNEPEITNDVEEIAAILRAEIVGLENRFKTEISLARKLSDFAELRKIPIEKVAKQINDALRYTFVFPIENYSENYNSALEIFGERGYQIPKIWNAWSNQGKPKDTGYRGINATIISSQNQKFELQFHTSESFRVKTETHDLYEERRNPNISKERDAEILQIMQELAAKIERPRGI